MLRSPTPANGSSWRSRAGLVLALLFAATPAFADIFAVDVGSDGAQDPATTDHCAEQGNISHCSLRAAIMIGNQRAGSHVINIGVPTVNVINGALPTVMAPVTINGNHATIDGNNHGCFSLTDSGTVALGHVDGASGSQLFNLVIGNCSGDGISANGHNYIFDGNFIGVDATGLIAMPNSGHGISVSASNVYPDTSSAFLLNLYSGFPVQPVDASEVNAFATDLATALASLEPVLIQGNVISGNALNGIEIFSQNIAAVTVTANMIGTDSTGNVAIPNGGDGVHLVGSSFGNLIGPGNVISGNGANGIRIDAGSVILPNFIMGNRIGLSATLPGVHIGNALSGIVTDTRPDTSAGSLNPSDVSLVIGPANVIADNQGANNNGFPDTLGNDSGGILITGASKRVKVIGNTIGLAEFPVGVPLASSAYGNAGDGIIVTVSGNSIGGSSIGTGNTIAANARHGIVVRGSSTTSTDILGNSIGVSPSFPGDLTLGNGVDGIHVDNASATTIGGVGNGTTNIVVANGRNGIALRNGGVPNGWSQLFQRNRVVGNAKNGSGIDIDQEHPVNVADGPHDEFPANYANLDQAPAQICLGNEGSGPCVGSTAPSGNGGVTTLQWTLETHGPAAFRLEFFAVDAASTTAATTMTFVGEQLVSTDASGKPAASAVCSGGRCVATLPVAAGGQWIVATATDITALTDTPTGDGSWLGQLKCFKDGAGVVLPSCNVNNTSEYSNVAAIPAAAPSVITDPATAITATDAMLNGTVSANGAATTVAFEYGATNSYGTAVAASESPLAVNATSAPVTAPISGLTCGTMLHFRANASNGIGGTINGNDQTLMTAPCVAIAPTATTNAATAVIATSATLNGVVTANGQATTVTFDYGTTIAYGGSGSPLTAPQSPLSGGAVNAAVSVDLAGLTCNTSYHFRVNADNGIGGTISGADQTFMTAVCAAQAPLVSTLAAGTIASTSAVLNGMASANGAQTTVTFDYGTTAAYGGLGSPLTAVESPLSSGASNAAVSVALSGLVCNTTYHFRANANNGVGGTINGADLSFTTTACALSPDASTNAASAITATSAVLNGTVSSNGSVTTVTFDYGATSGYGGAGSPLVAVESPLAAGALNAAVSTPLNGLSCNSTYHARVNANNGNGGTINGNDITFTTSACPAGAPTVTTTAASAILATAASLNGTVSSNGAQTDVTFEYGLTSAYAGPGSPLAASQSPLAPNASNAPVSVPLAGLACNTIYHFRVDADNGVGGLVSGNDQTFMTAACPAGAPDATTGIASAITATGATLNGTASSNGAQTVVTFEYGLTNAYGDSGSPVTAAQSPIAANASNAAVSADVTGLNCATTYHFRVDANNGNGGTIFGADQTFTSAACPAGSPSATTTAASVVTATTATLNGFVSANGAVTIVTFDYGTTIAYGGAGSPLTAIESPLPANANNAAVSVSLAALNCNTTYHVRANANNGNGGTVNGNDVSFQTAACPAGAPSATTQAASSITATSALLNGLVSANGAVTTVTFEYGTTMSYGGAGSPLTAVESPLPANANNAPVSAALSGLTCNTLYHVRVAADNGNGGTINGNDLMFTTDACPVSTTFSGMTATGTGIATAQLSGGGPTCGFAGAAFVGAPAAPPAGVSFPDGLFDFTASGCSGPISVTITFPTAFANSNQYWKYGATPDQLQAHWYTIGATQNLSMAGHVATFTLIDGAAGDDDGVVNGSISDPGGPAVNVVPGGNPEAASLPALSDTMLNLLAALVLICGAFAVRSRARGGANP
jgi:trimeric autotransporter adhesin